MPGFLSNVNLLELGNVSTPTAVTFEALTGGVIAAVKSVQSMLLIDPCTFTLEVPVKSWVVYVF